MLFRSYHTRYQDEAGGRWQKQAPTQVSGKDPATLYPTGPNWSVDPTGPEPPLNQDVNAMEPCGQPWEIEASLDRDFGLARSLRDGAPPSADSLISAALELAPDSEVVRPAHDPANTKEAMDHGGREPLPLSGRHSINQREGEGRVSPNKSKANLKRRLV